MVPAAALPEPWSPTYLLVSVRNRFVYFFTFNGIEKTISPPFDRFLKKTWLFGWQIGWMDSKGVSARLLSSPNAIGQVRRSAERTSEICRIIDQIGTMLNGKIRFGKFINTSFQLVCIGKISQFSMLSSPFPIVFWWSDQTWEAVHGMPICAVGLAIRPPKCVRQSLHRCT